MREAAEAAAPLITPSIVKLGAEFASKMAVAGYEHVDHVTFQMSSGTKAMWRNGSGKIRMYGAVKYRIG